MLAQVYETVGRCRETIERHLGPMLQWTEYAPVLETMVKFLTFSTVAGAPTSYQVLSEQMAEGDRCLKQDLISAIRRQCLASLLSSPQTLRSSLQHMFPAFTSVRCRPRANGSYILDLRNGGSCCEWQRTFQMPSTRMTTRLPAPTCSLRYARPQRAGSQLFCR